MVTLPESANTKSSHAFGDCRRTSLHGFNRSVLEAKESDEQLTFVFSCPADAAPEFSRRLG